MKKTIPVICVCSLAVAGVLFGMNFNKVSNKKILLIDNVSELNFSDEKFIDEYIMDFSDIEIVGKYTKSSENVTLKITAPDMKAYLTENEEKLSQCDSDEMYDLITEDIKNGKTKTTENTVVLPAEYKDGNLIAEINADDFEYLDAVSGGLMTYMRDFEEKNINALIKLMEDSE